MDTFVSDLKGILESNEISGPISDTIVGVCYLWTTAIIEEQEYKAYELESMLSSIDQYWAALVFGRMSHMPDRKTAVDTMNYSDPVCLEICFKYLEFVSNQVKEIENGKT